MHSTAGSVRVEEYRPGRAGRVRRDSMHDIYVLLRHRPRSIPQDQESA